ncbi:Omp28-related outer membrane protein [Vicingaceae bacterium]|nr:Omp28-related outer membrane protein [Vicingaceae bacterium]
MVDRILFDGEARPTFGINFNASVPSSSNPWFIRARDRTADGALVNVDIKGNYNNATRQIDVDVKSNFVDYPLPRDISMSLMIVEDSVTEGATYDQRNFYNATAGHPFAGLGDPIVGYVHEHVHRQTLPSTYGDATVIPSPIALYTDYQRNFNVSLDNSYNEGQVYLVAVIAYRGPGLEEYEVLNAKEVKLNQLLGVGISKNEAKGNTTFEVYPNPSKDITNISIDLEDRENVSVMVRDITGKEVMSQDLGLIAQGNQRIALNVSMLSNGIYFTTLRIGDKLVTKKITVNK